MNVFSAPFLAALAANNNLLAGKSIYMVLISRCPDLEGITEFQTSSLDTILAGLGWGEKIGTTTSTAATVTVGLDVARATQYATVTQNFTLPSNMPPCSAAAVAVLYGTAPGTLMFITNNPIGGQAYDTFHPSDALMCSVVNDANSLAVLMSWHTVGGNLAANEGAIGVAKAPPMFEAARTQHVYLYPQRINFIANPSFENDMKYWGRTGTMALTGTTPVGGGLQAAYLSGSDPIVLESNDFPMWSGGRKKEDGWTILAKIRTTGKVKIGLVSWDSDYAQTSADWGPDTEIWGPSPDGYISIRTLRPSNEAAWGRLRFEVTQFAGATPEMYIDQVLVEPGMFQRNGMDWPYFDGSTTFGDDGDFTWYGDHPNASYSCYYNHRTALLGRLFVWNVAPKDPMDPLTDREAEEQGLAFQWVPAGTPVHAHTDVLFPHDPHNPIEDHSGVVLPYYDPTAAPMGVENPWVALGLAIVVSSGMHAHSATPVLFPVTDNAFHALTSSSPILTVGPLLVVSDGAHVLTSSAPAMVVDLSISAATHAITSTTLDLVVDMVIANSTHYHTAETVILILDMNLGSGAHAHTASNVGPLTQVHLLEVEDAANALTSVEGQSIGIVNNGIHAHVATNAVLTQVHLLAADNAAHALTSTSAG